MAATVSLNTKISVEEKDEFQANAEALGMTPSAAIKVFVRMFNRCKGFPFDVRVQPHINYADSSTPTVTMKGGVAVVPSSWRDDDDDE